MNVTKKAAVLLLSFLLAAPASFAADDDKTEEQKQPGAPTYESPILSLLFLPVNLLIKMASITGPKSPSGSSTAAPSGSGK